MDFRSVAACLMLAFASSVAAAEFVGSNRCAGCHADVYRSWKTSAMARTSGAVETSTAEELPGEVSGPDTRSGYFYRVQRSGDRVQVFVVKRGAEPGKGTGLDLKYFIGSGAEARSFLTEQNGFLFQAPVAYYRRERSWHLAPGYAAYTTPYLTRAVNPGCLNCHASGVAHIAGTQNRYQRPPFLEDGVSCERCHGPGSEHVRLMSGGSGTGRDLGIVRTAKLDAARRDSVCEQCHLAGAVRVVRAGRTVDSFRAGEVLGEHISVFIPAGQGPEMTVTGHVENLAASACKRGAGDRLWCGTCHDPHPVKRVLSESEFVRERCRSCHDRRGCTAPARDRQARGDDCVACHMPRSQVVDADHVVYTDHSIPRRIRRIDSKAQPRTGALKLFGGGTAGAREEAIAYAVAGQKFENPVWRTRAYELLRAQVDEHSTDAELMEYLGVLCENRGDPAEAIALYRRALALDPTRVTLLVNAGAIHMRRGELDEAVRLWTDALRRSPGLLLVRTNLSVALEHLGRKPEARAVLLDGLHLNPVFAPALDALTRLK